MLSLYYKGCKKVRVSCWNKTGTAEELSRVGSTQKDRPMTIRTGNVRKQLGKDKRGYVCEFVQTRVWKVVTRATAIFSYSNQECTISIANDISTLNAISLSNNAPSILAHAHSWLHFPLLEGHLQHLF